MSETTPSSSTTLSRPSWRLEVEVEGEFRGLAVLVTPTIAISCTHILTSGRDAPHGEVTVHTLYGDLLPARVLKDGWFPPSEDDRGADVAILQLASPVPLEVEPARLSTSFEAGERFRFLGASYRTRIGVWTDGRIMGAGGPRSEWVQLGSGAAVEAGSSGGGVTNSDGEVIGLLVAVDPSTRNLFMLPISTIGRYWPPLLSLVGNTNPPDRQREPQPPVHPGIAADTIDGIDLLGRSGEAEAMAVLLAAASTSPPLSVGLFGDWGSGKSFFMHMLRAEIGALASLSRSARESGQPTIMCAEVRQITFNAWHYTDANLWASLVSAIFAGLAEPQAGEAEWEAKKRWEAERQRMATVLESAKAQRDEATDKSVVANAEVDRLRSELAELEKEKAQERKNLTGLKPAAQAAWSDPAVKKRVEAAQKHFGEEIELEQIRAFAVAGLSGVRRAARIWRLMRGSQRRRLVWWLAFATVLGVSAFVAIPLVLRDSPVLAQVFGSLVALIVPITVAGGRIAGRISEGLGVVESAMLAAAAAEQDEHERLENQKQAFLAEIAQLDARQTMLQKEILNAEARAVAAEAEVNNVSTGRLMANFIAERGASKDYRSQLGMIAMIRRDFQLLTGLMDLEPEGDSSVPPIERIVLYIDDLDRCPPDRVVEVLQAIHLLLGLELFVVVVAVDARWLVSSLELHFEKVLGSRTAAQDDKRHWSASPMNYLEKIFQIPFQLSKMDGEPYAQLVGNLLEQVDTVVTSQVTDSATRSDAGISTATSTETAQQITPVLTSSLKRLTPAGLMLSEVEIEFAQKLAPLIGTPRAAKRLTNLYRLIRVSLPEEVLAAMDESGYHEPILLLLAIMVGQPSDAPTLFGEVRDASDETPWTDFGGYVKGLAEVRAHLRHIDTVAAVKPWIPVVARYSFHLKG